MLEPFPTNTPCGRPSAPTSAATTAHDSIPRWATARPSTTKRPWLEYQRMECQHNRVNIPRPYASLRGSPLTRHPLGEPKRAFGNSSARTCRGLPRLVGWSQQLVNAEGLPGAARLRQALAWMRALAAWWGALSSP